MSDEAPFGYDEAGKPRAPYGKTATGRIKKDSRGRPSKTAGRGPAAPKPRTTRPSSSGTRRKTENYTQTIEAVLHMTLAPFTMIPSTQLDAAVFLDHSANLAVAGNAVAQQYPAIGEYCQKAMKAGPVGLLLTALLPPLAQVFENHGWAPHEVTSRFGAVPAAQYAQRLVDRARQMQPATPEPQVNGVNGYAHAHAGV